MLALLRQLVENFVCWIQTGATNGFNAVIDAIGTAIAAVAGLLPDLPELPELPSYMVTAEGWVAWVFPVHQAVLVLAFIVTAWVVWQVVALVLRWAKAI